MKRWLKIRRNFWGLIMMMMIPFHILSFAQVTKPEDLLFITSKNKSDREKELWSEFMAQVEFLENIQKQKEQLI